MQLIRIIQDLLLSEFIIFVVLFLAFAYLTRRALALHEYVGYGLGWLIGIFFMVVYSSSGVRPSSQAVETEVTLSFLQLILPSICGAGLGLAVLWIIAQAASGARRQGIAIATMTALGVVLLFLTFVADSETRRMIGIFSLAFAICAAFVLIVFRRGGTPSATTGFTSQSAVPTEIQGKSRLDEIREKFRNNP